MKDYSMGVKDIHPMVDVSASRGQWSGGLTRIIVSLSCMHFQGKRSLKHKLS